MLLNVDGSTVSTHSRPKAAAARASGGYVGGGSFNTQPPEGGCEHLAALNKFIDWFQHTAARRRLRY